MPTLGLVVTRTFDRGTAVRKAGSGLQLHKRVCRQSFQHGGVRVPAGLFQLDYLGPHLIDTAAGVFMILPDRSFTIVAGMPGVHLRMQSVM